MHTSLKLLDAEESPFLISAGKVIFALKSFFGVNLLRYKVDNVARSLSLQKQLQRYASVSLNVEVATFLNFKIFPTYV